MGDRRVDAERAFAAAVALAVVAASALAVVAPAPASAAGDGPREVAYDGGVPAEYDFSVPERGGTATVDGERFDSLAAALDAADPGDTVRLRGRFDERVTVDTPNVTLVGAGVARAVVDGSGEGDVVTVAAPGVTLRNVWVRNSGYDASGNDAGIWIDAPRATVADSRVTEITFGIWVDGVGNASIENVTIVGRERVTPVTDRGNGIQLWRAADASVVDTRITDARDGIYYSWAESVRAENNTLWDLRYGVHYMYSDDNDLVGNRAFDNDVGYALMVSEHLYLRDNVAVNNTAGSGGSGHGIMVKSIDHSELRGNHLVGNDKGLFVYNSQNNTVADNLVLENKVGIHVTAGSTRERVHGNSFVRNDDAVRATLGTLVVWNASAADGEPTGNYWHGARDGDVDGDGVSEVRHRPEGLVDRLVREHPTAAVFAASPAFDAVRLAESSVPLVESPGVVDYHPLANAPHDWRRYYARDRTH